MGNPRRGRTPRADQVSRIGKSCEFGVTIRGPGGHFPVRKEGEDDPVKKRIAIVRNALDVFNIKWSMAGRKANRTRSARFTSHARGGRETFRIAVSVPRPKHGTDKSSDEAARTLSAAEKIFESLIESGRLPRKK